MAGGWFGETDLHYITDPSSAVWSGLVKAFPYIGDPIMCERLWLRTKETKFRKALEP